MPQLEPLGDGRLRHRGDGFTATIRSDGSVELRDSVDHDLELVGFHVRRRRMEFAPLDRRDPSIVAFEEEAMFPLGRLPVAGVRVRFGGLADWTIGQKHTGAKRAFLVATAGLRYRLAYAWRRARMQEQLAALGDQLVAVWRDPGRSLPERKRRLFALWDECAEPIFASPSPFDALLSAAGSAARAKIAAFVRMAAPPGTPDAFTGDELARLNAIRRSVARFEPYSEGGSPRSPELPELPALPGRPAQVQDETEAVAYGPTPEPVVAVPRAASPPAQPVSKRRLIVEPPRIKIGPVQLKLGGRLPQR